MRRFSLVYCLPRLLTRMISLDVYAFKHPSSLLQNLTLNFGEKLVWEQNTLAVYTTLRMVTGQDD